MMKKLCICLLLLALTLTAAMPALANASVAPTVTVSASEIAIRAGETGSFIFTLQNPGDHFINTVTNSWTDPNDVMTSLSTPPADTTKVLKLTIADDAQAQQIPGNVTIILDNGATFNFTLQVIVRPPYALPQLKWHRVELNPENGYPQLKLSMTDDAGLMNVCFIRSWTDENGASQEEIYDIISLYDQTAAVVFRTLDKPGEYSVQINDNDSPTNRRNTKVLITLVDTDQNGVADAYYTDDIANQTALDVDGGLSPVQPVSNPA